MEREREEASKSKALQAKGKGKAVVTNTAAAKGKEKEAVSSKQQAGREETEEEKMLRRKAVERRFLDIEATGPRKAARAQVQRPPARENKRRRTESGLPAAELVQADAERVEEIIGKWSALGRTFIGKAWGKITPHKIHINRLKKHLLPEHVAAISNGCHEVLVVDEQGRRYTAEIRKSGNFFELGGQGWTDFLNENLTEHRQMLQIWTYGEGPNIGFGVFFYYHKP